MNRHLTLLCSFVVLATASGVTPSAHGEGGQSCLGRSATIVADEREVKGTPGADVIVADRTASIEAGGGDDLICLTGEDYHSVDAGAGDDRIAGGSGNEQIDLGPGDDHVDAAGGKDFVTGGDRSGDDVLLGGDNRDVLSFEGAVAVRIDVERGIARGAGRDRIAGFRTFVGTRGRDVFRGDGENNNFTGKYGGDEIMGRGGDDTLIGAADPERRNQGPGQDRIAGGAGDDRLIAQGGRDIVSGGPGDDFLRGGSPGEQPGDLGIGGSGRDRCTEFEIRRSCERRR